MGGVRIVDYLSDILKLITLINAYESNSEYPKKDVRRAFLAKMTNALCVYYLGHDFEFMASKLQAQGNYPAEEVPHIENLGGLYPWNQTQDSWTPYHSILNYISLPARGYALKAVWMKFSSR